METKKAKDGKFYFRSREGSVVGGNVYHTYAETVTLDENGIGCSNTHDAAMDIMAQDSLIEPYCPPELDPDKEMVVVSQPEQVKTPAKPVVASSSTKCSVAGCNNKRVSKGYCGRHYQQWRRGTLENKEG